MTNTTKLMRGLSRLFPIQKTKPPHIWKEIKRQNLGSFVDFGIRPEELTTMYRVAVHEQCLLTGEKRIREVQSLHPEY